MIGQDAVNTAQAFLDGVGFDGVVLTKLDGDARGGAALSVAKVTGRQVMFASNGEKLDDFDAFHPDRMASRILGMGDVLTLIEQAEKAFDKDAGRGDGRQVRPRRGLHASRTSCARWQAVRKMGSMSKLLGMLPGMGAMREQIENIDEREIDRITAIIQSMTPEERRDHKILNGSRRQRIARGSGSHGVRRQPAGRAVHRRAEDDAAAGGERRDAGHARDAGMPGMGRGKKAKGKSEGRAEEGQGRALRQPGQAGLEQRQAEARASGEAIPDPEDFSCPTAQACSRPDSATGSAGELRPTLHARPASIARDPHRIGHTSWYRSGVDHAGS